MISRRNWILRCVCAGLILYIFTHISIRTGASDFISELQQSGRNLAALENVGQDISSNTNNNNIEQQQPPQKLISAKVNVVNEPMYDQQSTFTIVSNNNANNLSDNKQINEHIRKFNIETTTKKRLEKFIENFEEMKMNDIIDDTSSIDENSNHIMKIETKQDEQQPIRSDEQQPIENQRFDVIMPTTLNNNVSSVQPTTMTMNNTSSLPEKSLNERLKELLKCHERPMIPRTQQRGDYWVLYNYVMAEERHECYDSITYTTHADYTFMDNLVPLIERWRGPVSVALHAPGSDFTATLNTIKYLRDCTSPLVKQHVTFHVFFSTKHVPKQVPKHDRVLNDQYNCSLAAPYLNVDVSHMYKNQRKLLYPVNVGRNVARESAQTHFILASDIELYPSLNLIPKFLNMIVAPKGAPKLRKNRVFALSLFEVDANYTVPDNKTKLKEMLQNGTAIEFHKKVCHSCHNVPKSKEWQNANVTEGLHIFHVGKRTGPYIHWEPIFIGTHDDPLYDERLSWEGKSDKMTQGYALCVLDYDFQILDNAFLCHRPGIKTYKKDAKRATLAAKTNQLIRRIIFPELKILYGVRKGCAV
ncbi:beta-1,4-glucuronyltransferase 1-like [Chrysoperla carnea]|uniref:beta-1,4-glucuronyltransferase 1-like n=1 Tax=Chrysoperla carnea TaxID=189513 RepID=UPI001D0792B7|nr:beta-1,4-glucuronyltransferase 1-like [Chrysoperla carnea]XP_044728932.1 beta-1,4-glucuronyltransferase 1-like [Chrysoperla carnea]